VSDGILFAGHFVIPLLFLQLRLLLLEIVIVLLQFGFHFLHKGLILGNHSLPLLGPFCKSFDKLCAFLFLCQQDGGTIIGTLSAGSCRFIGSIATIANSVLNATRGQTQSRLFGTLKGDGSVLLKKDIHSEGKKLNFQVQLQLKLSTAATYGKGGALESSSNGSPAQYPTPEQAEVFGSSKAVYIQSQYPSLMCELGIVWNVGGLSDAPHCVMQRISIASSFALIGSQITHKETQSSKGKEEEEIRDLNGRIGRSEFSMAIVKSEALLDGSIELTANSIAQFRLQPRVLMYGLLSSFDDRRSGGFCWGVKWNCDF
jgi:hypothetical protein